MEFSERKVYHKMNTILQFHERWMSNPKDLPHTNSKCCMCAGGQIYDRSTREITMDPKEIIYAKSGMDIIFILDCTGISYLF